MQAFLLEFVQKFALKKGGKGGGYVSFSALPLTILPFFCSCFNFLNELALKKLATQATNHPYLSWVVGMDGRVPHWGPIYPVPLIPISQVCDKENSNV